MLAETMAAAFRKQNEGCFTCGDKSHLKRIALRRLIKDLQKSALAAVKECIYKDCKSKFDIEGKPILGNSKQGAPQVLFNKNQGQITSFPSNPQHLAVLPSIYQP